MEENLILKAQDLNYQHDVLKKFAEAQRQKVESAEGQKAAPEPTIEPIKPEAEVFQAEPKKEEKTEVVKEPEVQVPKSWDEDEAEPTKEESPKFDFSKLGSALELGEIKSEDEFVTKVSELKSKLKQVEEAPLQGIPDEFKEVLEITKKTGDWKAFLAESLTDYSKVNPLELYENQLYQIYKNDPKYRNADGSMNEDAFYADVDAIPEVQRKAEGIRLQQQLIAGQNARKAQLAAQAQARVEQAEKSLSKATKSLNEILPFENYGIKFEPKQSNALHEGIISSKLTKKHLGGMGYNDLVRSGADMQSITRTIALAEYGEKMLKFKSNNSKVEAKKELLDKVQNAQITTPGSAPNPETKEKVISNVDKYKQQLLSQSQRKGL